MLLGRLFLVKRFGFLDKGEDLNHLMIGTKAYVSYGANIRMTSEFQYPSTRLFEVFSLCEACRSLLPIVEVLP